MFEWSIRNKINKKKMIYMQQTLCALAPLRENIEITY